MILLCLGISKGTRTSEMLYGFTDPQKVPRTMAADLLLVIRHVLEQCNPTKPSKATLGQINQLLDDFATLGKQSRQILKISRLRKRGRKRVFGDFARRVDAQQGHKQGSESSGTQMNGTHSFARTRIWFLLEGHLHLVQPVCDGIVEFTQLAQEFVRQIGRSSLYKTSSSPRRHATGQHE
jgi:hypothetical protein